MWLASSTKEEQETSHVESTNKEKAVKVSAVYIVKQMFAGSLARATAATILIPVDTCKTRLQFVGSMNKSEVKQYTGFIHCAKSIAREEGFLAFYRGIITFLFSFFISLFLSSFFIHFFTCLKFH